MRLSGILAENLCPYLELSLPQTDGTLLAQNFLIDTGCTMEMILPYVVVATLGWPLYRTLSFEQADGSIVDADEFAGEVIVGGYRRPVSVVAVGTKPILGVRFLQGWQFCMDVIGPDEGGVRLESL